MILVIRYTKRKLYRYLAVAILILIPAWDVILGLIIYLPACLFVPKVAIYETVETEGIYYEGVNNYIFDFDKQSTEPFSERIYIGSTRWILKEGYEYTESKVVEEHDLANRQILIDSSYYRCTERFSKKRSTAGTVNTNCIEIERPKSPYMVKVITKQIGTTTFQFKKITERATGRVLGEYNQAIYAYAMIPFFNWLYHGDGSLPSIRCPYDERGEFSDGKFNTFEYKVLRPKNKQTGGRK